MGAPAWSVETAWHGDSEEIDLDAGAIFGSVHGIVATWP